MPVETRTVGTQLSDPTKDSPNDAVEIGPASSSAAAGEEASDMNGDSGDEKLLESKLAVTVTNDDSIVGAAAVANAGAGNLLSPARLPADELSVRARTRSVADDLKAIELEAERAQLEAKLREKVLRCAGARLFQRGVFVQIEAVQDLEERLLKQTETSGELERLNQSLESDIKTLREQKKELDHTAHLENMAKSQTIADLEAKIVDLKRKAQEQSGAVHELNAQLAKANAAAAAKAEEEKRRQDELAETRRQLDAQQTANQALERDKTATDGRLKAQQAAAAELQKQLSERASALSKLEAELKALSEQERAA